MTDSNDYRLYLEERFNSLNTHLNAQHIETHELLDSIEKHVKLTNGRVLELEKSELTHIITCPQLPKINRIEEEIKDVTFFARHPKLGVGIIGFFVIMFLGSVLMFYTSAKTNVEALQHNDKLMFEMDSTYIPTE